MRIVPIILGSLAVFATNTPPERVENVGYFMGWAEKISGLKNVGPLPEIALLSDAEIQREYCSEGVITADCQVYGYLRGTRIAVNKELSPRDMEMTIVHELAHHLHFVTGTFQSRCWSEKHAAMVEWAYESAVYDSWEPFVFNKDWYNCP